MANLYQGGKIHNYVLASNLYCVSGRVLDFEKEITSVWPQRLEKNNATTVARNNKQFMRKYKKKHARLYE